MALYRKARTHTFVGDGTRIIEKFTLLRGEVIVERGESNVVMEDNTERSLTKEFLEDSLTLEKTIPFHPKVGDTITFVGRNYKILEVKGVGNYQLLTFFNESAKQNQEIYLNKVSHVIRMPNE